MQGYHTLSIHPFGTCKIPKAWVTGNWVYPQFLQTAPLVLCPSSIHMLGDLQDVIEWGNGHISILTGREDSIRSVAVWRGTCTTGFVRHKPVWEACAVEQMLYENHIPFTIFLDNSLRRGASVLFAGRWLIIGGGLGGVISFCFW